MSRWIGERETETGHFYWYPDYIEKTGVVALVSPAKTDFLNNGDEDVYVQKNKTEQEKARNVRRNRLTDEETGI